MMQPETLMPIPPQDWEATPETVQNALISLLPLKTELDSLRSRLQFYEGETKQNIARYHELVDQSFLTGLSEPEAAEMQRLGEAIDRGNDGFYAAATHRLQQVIKGE